MTISNHNPNKAVGLSPAAKAERERALREANAKRPSGPTAKTPAPGSREARVAEATAQGTVKPSKSDRPAKIPADKNLTSKRDAESDVKAKADAELDKAVAPKKPVKDPDMLTVGDVARELGVDPKRARARLRASGKSAVEGRWPKVRRGTPEHDALIAALSAKESREADAADAT